MNKVKILTLTAVYAASFGYYGCKKNETPVTAAEVRSETTAQAVAGPEKRTAAKKPEKAYTRTESYFKLPDYKGGEIDLAAYAGKPVMVMFFTEHCPFCRKAAPFIETMNKKYSPKGLGVIGVCVEDEASAAEAFAKAFGLTFPVAYGGAAVSRKYKTQGVPYIFLLNKTHAVHNVWAGYDPEFDKPIIQGIEEVIK
ncbi:MAG: TlpA disulfide reductase family protein [Elusimicrobiales bacterium]|jgi:thiol-disulfide isomerase/thioredoxin